MGILTNYESHRKIKITHLKSKNNLNSSIYKMGRREATEEREREGREEETRRRGAYHNLLLKMKERSALEDESKTTV